MNARRWTRLAAFAAPFAALFALSVGCAPANAFTGTVVDAGTGQPIAGAVVTAASGIWRSDAAGRFTSEHTAATISARAPGYLRQTVTVSGDGPLTIALAPFKPRAVYLSAFGATSTTLRDAAVALTETTAVNALVIDMKGDRGITPYHSAAREAVGANAHVSAPSPETDRFGAIVASLHRRNLYLIARIVVFKDDPLAAAHPEWTVRDAAGEPWHDREGLRWVDPFINAVWRHNIDLAEEAARAGFDEIQFDYVRFPDSAGVHFSMPNTRANRVAAIVGFLDAARERLQPYNVFLAADIFGYVCWNRDDTAIGQQLETLAAPLDYISPMLYPSGFTWGLPGLHDPVSAPGQIVRRSLAEAKRRTGLPGVRFRPWLQAFRDYAFDRRAFGADEIRAQIDAAQAEGSDGWMLWNPRNHYESEQLPR
ncbi:putative glycoside hydrolase [Trinickia caryophylli]|uniref:DUF4015 domain-containing protein n=1 Tax=Trinickia caryophylli TaxID=28094 RepID=A0A1X7D0R7_TRICW|nr:putative glycoside hydrolase [Trinickia caryophylli]PMS13557.1 GTP-binding protein [Trinickia caryophylli]TRX15276.1 GTP-binding protein [Trinickia caryophylli]WQE15152.1 putative glycoside hydrolase [Trinickia caryophylli]SMF06581.1 hypothetical protein SAMN06295900_102233 [Trinickia caryophylli]GLU31109.1 hypothetical protein Busp01_09510 [Trinickia caryophylli]